NPVAENERSEDEGEKNQQCGFPSRKDRRAGLSGIPIREAVNQLCDAPEDDQNRPVEPDQVAEAQHGIHAVEQESDAQQDQEQGREKGTAMMAAVAHALLTTPCGLFGTRRFERTAQRRRQSAIRARVGRYCSSCTRPRGKSRLSQSALRDPSARARGSVG